MTPGRPPRRQQRPRAALALCSLGQRRRLFLLRRSASRALALFFHAGRAVRDGQEVVFQGLTSRAELNGQGGFAELFDAGSKRYAVKIGLGHERVRVRGENLRSNRWMSG